MQMALAVATGGAIGAVLRWLIATALNNAQVPWGTWVVNLVGSFLIGVVFIMFADREISEFLERGVIVGLLGGFTTFSAFSLEVVHLLQRGQLKIAMLYLLASVILCIVAAFAGMSVGRQL